MKQEGSVGVTVGGGARESTLCTDMDGGENMARLTSTSEAHGRNIRTSKMGQVSGERSQRVRAVVFETKSNSKKRAAFPPKDGRFVSED